ncbi:MAG: hypothetical protein OHK0029_14790 [Armatimonadaceae bacterium]
MRNEKPDAGFREHTSDDISSDLLAEMQYEPRDASVPKIFRWIGYFMLFFVGSIVLTIGIYQFFIPDWARLGQIAEPSPYRPLPPHPQVQAEPREDMAFFRLAEDKQVLGLDGAVPNTLPEMTIDAAIEKIASEKGISGIRGTALRGGPPTYPGNAMYPSLSPKMTDDVPHGEAHGEEHGDTHGAAGAVGSESVTEAGKPNVPQPHGGNTDITDGEPNPAEHRGVEHGTGMPADPDHGSDH